jgi:hypothetical protein
MCDEDLSMDPFDFHQVPSELKLGSLISRSTGVNVLWFLRSLHFNTRHAHQML